MFNFCPSFYFFIWNSFPSTFKSRAAVSLFPCPYRTPHVKGLHLFQPEDNSLSTYNTSSFCFCLLLTSKQHGPEHVVAAEDTENSLLFLAS